MCTATDEIKACDGYRSLLGAVARDEAKPDSLHDYRKKLQWVLDRAQHYADKTGLAASELLDAWERNRDYWYMNYYQEANQPEIKQDNVRVFETTDDLKSSIGKPAFRCPHCDGISSSPYECNSGLEVALMGGTKGPCDWKVYGLFTDMGKGVYVFVKAKLSGQKIFMPLSWEQADEPTFEEPVLAEG